MSNKMQNLKCVTILLVEDNPADVRLTREAFKEAKVYNDLFDVGDGVAALDFLYRRGEFTSAPIPDLILLDLNLPKKNGMEVLSEIKSHKSLCSMPVVVLTTSKADEDILRSYELHANAFISKPVNLEKFLKVIQTIEQFWLAVATLPSSCNNKKL